jgi:hypothetical protein
MTFVARFVVVDEDLLAAIPSWPALSHGQSRCPRLCQSWSANI